MGTEVTQEEEQQSRSIPPPEGGGRLPSGSPGGTPVYRYQDGGQQELAPLPPSLTISNARVVETPTPIEEAGSAVHRGEANYI